MCLVEWKHFSELNSCLFKQGVAKETLGLVTCCQHTENEATTSHRIDSEGSSYLVTEHIDPALVTLATPSMGMFRLEQEPLLPGVASPPVSHQGPKQHQCNYSLDPRHGVTALLQANGASCWG